MEIRTEVKNLLVPGDRYLAPLLLIFKGPCLIDFSLDQRFISGTVNIEVLLYHIYYEFHFDPPKIKVK